MNARLNELQKMVLQEFGKGIVQCNFDPKPRGQTFYQKQFFGWAACHLTFVPHDEGDFDVSCDVALRIDEVEVLVNEGNKLLSKSEKNQTATLGAELGNIVSGQPMRWSVVTEKDIGGVVSELLTAFVKIGIPYLAKYSNYEEAFLVLSDNGPSSWLHSPIHSGRCQRALALAFVMRQYEQIDGLIEQGEVFLKNKNDYGLRSFQMFVERIRAMILNGDRP
ncbi:MAG: hypothetical protein WC328_14460 [Kiritimatiellia bacterium]